MCFQDMIKPLGGGSHSLNKMLECCTLNSAIGHDLFNLSIKCSSVLSYYSDLLYSLRIVDWLAIFLFNEDVSSIRPDKIYPIHFWLLVTGNCIYANWWGKLELAQLGHLTADWSVFKWHIQKPMFIYSLIMHMTFVTGTQLR